MSCPVQVVDMSCFGILGARQNAKTPNIGELHQNSAYRRVAHVQVVDMSCPVQLVDMSCFWCSWTHGDRQNTKRTNIGELHQNSSYHRVAHVHHDDIIYFGDPGSPWSQRTTSSYRRVAHVQLTDMSRSTWVPETKATYIDELHKCNSSI